MIILSNAIGIISYNAFTPIRKLGKTKIVTVSILPLHEKTKGAKQFQWEAPSS